MTRVQKEKPKLIRINQIKRSRRHIEIGYTQGDEEFKIRSNEMPLPGFLSALDLMAPLAVHVCDFPPSYDLNMRVMALHVGAMRDVDTVSVTVQKEVTKSGKVMALTTPPALLAVPKTEGGTTEPLAKEYVDQVEEVIEQAKQYILGNRAQGTLPLDKSEDEDGEAMDGLDDDLAPADPATEAAPAKRKRKAAAAK